MDRWSGVEATLTASCRRQEGGEIGCRVQGRLRNVGQAGLGVLHPSPKRPSMSPPLDQLPRFKYQENCVH